MFVHYHTNIPWIEVKKSPTLLTVDGKSVLIRKGTLTGTVYGAVDEEGNKIKINASLEDIRNAGFRNPEEVQYTLR